MYISGIVFLRDDGKSAYGATVTVKQTGQTATTNLDGTFSINVPDFSSVLVFDYHGLTLPVEKTAADITGQTVWLQLDPREPWAQIQVKKDYKLAYWGLGIAAVLGISALILVAAKSAPQPAKEIKEVEV